MDPIRRSSALDNILKMFGLSNTPTVPLSDDEVVGDVDEPPDQVPELKTEFVKNSSYTKSSRPTQNFRRESLLTQAIMGTSDSHDTSILPTRGQQTSRALSTTSSLSVPSTAELTSDGDLTSPARSASPSPPLPINRFPATIHTKGPMMTNKVLIAPISKDDKPAIVDAGEAAVEKSLGRKRCIMFACSEKTPESTKESSPGSPIKEEVKPEPTARKCRLTFACPTRQDSDEKPSIAKQETRSKRTTSPAPVSPRTKSAAVSDPAIPEQSKANVSIKTQKAAPVFHEFSKSQDETDAWVNDPIPNKPKLTIDDCMKKENAIRKIAEEAEEEADEEEREQEALDNEDGEEQDVEDDFAPSSDDEDDVVSDGGNESDDENGFAASDDESDDGSEYLFWAPSTVTTVATSTDNLTHISSRQRSRGSSISSNQSHDSGNQRERMRRRNKINKAIRMRPGTPELPDSTDFVCGTLDEDRPLEAAYISCRELRKREKHILIPQDIDPSFPTTDPDDNEDEEDDDLAEESGQPDWLHQQFGSMEDDDRGRRPSAIRISPQVTPKVPRVEPVRPNLPKRSTTGRSPAPMRHRSPPPPKHRSPPPPKHRSSPPSRRLFGQSPNRARSPAPHVRLNSPRGSPTNAKMPLGITITRLAQRPNTHRTASLPHTPNPFFRNWKNGSPATSRIPSGAVTPGVDQDEPRPDLHVRGPVDIVIGLEKKRQKRKEKFWRQHCRKAAKEHAERKCAPGRGVERMKELGLESAERTRGYGLGQQAQLVLSL